MFDTIVVAGVRDVKLRHGVKRKSTFILRQTVISKLNDFVNGHVFCFQVLNGFGDECIHSMFVMYFVIRNVEYILRNNFVAIFV